MKSRLIVSVVIKKGGKILLGRKPDGRGPYPNTWHLPGGGLEIGEETAEDAVAREIKEETGLDVENITKVAFDTDIEHDKNNEETYYIFLQFVCDLKGGKLKAGDDMKSFQWVDVKDIKKYKLNKPTQTLFKKLGYIK
ncbi:MAG: NUDIX domain-containing protein [Candidatus Aenigmarchaeota archaeon]|nr:NUDIX domain-containing protein [Candidatus Aenigmarchaeota archaeon]